MNAAERLAALHVQADRLKGRLDFLNRALSGDQDAWLNIQVRMPPTVAEVVIDKLISEERQESLAYATLVKTITALSDEQPATTQKKDPLDELGKRRNEKLGKVGTTG